MQIFYSPSAKGFFHEFLFGAPTQLVPDPAWIAPEGAETGDDAPKAPLVEVKNPDCKIPDDAIEVSQEKYDALFEEHGRGQRIIPGPDGFPISSDQEPPTPEQVMADLRAERNIKLTETDPIIARHRDEVERGGKTTLTAGQYTDLQTYRQELRDLPDNIPNNVKSMADVSWPVSPQ